MCLYIKEEIKLGEIGEMIIPEMKVAEKDIVCYKILSAYVRNGHTFYRTPFTGNSVGLGEIVRAEGFMDIQHLSSSKACKYGFKTVVSEGCIHTFKDRNDAIRIASDKDRDGYWIDNPVIVRCKIPKGTKYYEGVFESTFLPSYASETLQYGLKATPCKQIYQ